MLTNQIQERKKEIEEGEKKTNNKQISLSAQKIPNTDYNQPVGTYTPHSLKNKILICPYVCFALPLFVAQCELCFLEHYFACNQISERIHIDHHQFKYNNSKNETIKKFQVKKWRKPHAHAHALYDLYSKWNEKWHMNTSLCSTDQKLEHKQTNQSFR